MSNAAEVHIPEQAHGHQDSIRVAVSTTSGFYPTDGYSEVSINQHVLVELKKAAATLHLTNTEGWLATFNKRTIDPSRSYKENGLHGQVEIDWGPSEGGGGA